MNDRMRQKQKVSRVRPYAMGICSLLLSCSLLTLPTMAEESGLTTNGEEHIGVDREEAILVEEKEAEESSLTFRGEETEGVLSLEAPNLIANGGFDQIDEASGNWTGSSARDWEQPWLPSSVKKENGEVGIKNGRLEITARDTYRVAVAQTVTVDASKAYQLRYDVTTINVKGSGVRVRIRSLDEAGKELTPKEFVYTPYVTGNQQTSVEQVVRFSPETKKIKVEIFFENSIGQAQLDNLSLTAYTEPMVEPMEPEKPAAETGVVELARNKVYLPIRSDLIYKPVNAEVAKVENQLVYPLREGRTEVEVYDGESKVSQFELLIHERQETVFDQIRANWEDISLANSRYQEDDTEMRAFLARLEEGVAQTLSLWVEPVSQPVSIFQDLDFSKSSHLTTAYRRLEQMAQVIENKGSRYYHDRSLLDKVRSGMNWLYVNVYNEEKTINGNWWDYEIGTPRAIVNSLIYLYPYFQQEEIDTYTQPISKFVPNPTMIRMTTDQPVPAVGGNQTDLSKVAILQGALREDKDRVRAGAQGLIHLMKFVDKGEGFYPDGSFIDHTNVAYTGAYGNVLIEGFSQLLPVIQGTEFALEEPATRILYEWIDRAFMPILVKGELMDMTRGRSISRATGESHVQAMEILRSLLRIAESAEPVKQERIRSFVKGQLQADTFYNGYKSLKSYKDIDLMNRVLQDASISPMTRQDAIYAFNNMDKFVYHNAQKDFSFALSLHSSKTQNYEDMNNENRKGWHTADGMVYLYNGDLSHYSNHYWPTVDPYRLPGTTEARSPREDGSGETTLASDFVGATQLGNRLASIAMDFNNWDKSVTARKAWFVFGDRIVFLGTDVSHQSPDGVSTTIENRKLLPDKTYQYSINGEAVTIDETEQTVENIKTFYMTNGEENQSIGYAFLTPLSTKVQVETRKGKWSDINYGQSKDEVENRYVTLWHEHATGKSNYAYVMLANQSLSQVQQASEDIQLLEQTQDLQVVYDQGQQIWGVVKYTDSPYQLDSNLTLTGAGLYVIEKTDAGYRLSYYHPSKHSADHGLILTNMAATLSVEEEPTAAKPSVVLKVDVPASKEQVGTEKEKTPSNPRRQAKEKEQSLSQKRSVLPQTGSQSAYAEQVSLFLGLGLLFTVALCHKKASSRLDELSHQKSEVR